MSQFWWDSPYFVASVWAVPSNSSDVLTVSRKVIAPQSIFLEELVHYSQFPGELLHHTCGENSDWATLFLR